MVFLGFLLFSIFTNFNSSYAQFTPSVDQSVTRFVAVSDQGYQLYKNDQYGFSIEYPKEWKAVEHLDQKYVAKTILISPDENFQLNTGVIKNNNPYASLTSQEILGQITSMMRDGCSKATFQSRGFTCTEPQFNTNMTEYRGVPLYEVGMAWTKTFSSGQSIKWTSVWKMIPSGNDVWLLIIEGSSDEFLIYMEESKHMYYSLDISDIHQNVPILLQDTTPTIPHWIKNTAKWWAAGSVGDDDFIKGIQYLIQQRIIIVPETPINSSLSHGLPSWIKNTAKWWSEGSVGDDDFIKGLEYLIQNGIIAIQASSTSVTQMVEYTDKDGTSLSVLAIPNEVLLFVSQDSNPNDVNQMISSNGGTMLSQVQDMGFFLIKVNNVKNFISSSYKYPFVINSFPNEILSEYAPMPTESTVAQYTDLKKTSWSDMAIPTSTKVLVVQIDDFIYPKGTCNGQNLPHGICVSRENNLLSGGDVSVIHLQDRYGSDSKINVDDVLQNIRDAISIAAKYEKKLVINLSLGVPTSDENDKLYPDAEQRVKDDITHELDAVKDIPWFQKGNVIISKSAPNDPIDLSKITNDLQKDDQYATAFKSYITTSQTKDDENGNQKLTTFVGGATAAYGNGVVFVKREDNCGGGASCAVYGTTAIQALIWSWYPDITSAQVVDLIKSNTNTPQAGKYPVVDLKGAFMSAWQQYKCISNCPNFGQSANTINQLGQSQSTSTQTAPNGNKPYGGYSTPDGYCQGTYGSGYQYDASRHLCVPTSSSDASGGNNGGGTQTHGTITPARDLSGTWSGSFSMKDTTSDGCSFSGTWEATLAQNGNDLSGSISIIQASSPDYPANDFCTLAPGTFNFGGGTVSSSSFQFDSSDFGGFHATGYSTTDLIHGNFNECSDESCASGSFTGSRR
jgi:hypothetical protein